MFIELAGARFSMARRYWFASAKLFFGYGK